MYTFRNLRPNQDFEWIFEFVNRSDCQDLMPRRGFIKKDDWFRWFLRFYHDFYVVEKKSPYSTESICGFVISYDYRIYDSHCKIYGYLKQGINSEVLNIFLQILFKEYPLNKVFIELTENDKFLLTSAVESGFEQEAVLPDNKYMNGTYYDLLILSINSKKIFNKVG